MSVSSISSSNTAYASTVRPQAEAGEVQRAGREVRSDGDSDDGGSAASKSPAPSVNLDGQSVGKMITTSA